MGSRLKQVGTSFGTCYVAEVHQIRLERPTRHFRMEYFEALESTKRRTCLSGNEWCTYVQDTRVTYKSVSCLHEFLATWQSYSPYTPLIGNVLVSITLIYVCLHNTV